MRIRVKAFIVFFALWFSSCVNEQPLVLEDSIEPPETEDSFPLQEETAETSAAAEVPEPEPDYAVFIAVGDNLYHDPMIRPGKNGYDFEPIYSELADIAQGADLAFINQETLLAGPDYGFSGYPRFNTPQELGHALRAAGFDVVNHATNHIMDKGEKAIFSTMDFWDTVPEVTVLGIHRSQDERAVPALVTVNNITFGFLSYTCHTNYIPVPKDKPWLVSLADTEIMAGELDALRPLCDVLVVSMHWGDEYVHAYNREQEALTAVLAEHRVDLVIGHHPHVIQPVETVTRPDGKTMLCFYSLGNLVSAQTQAPTMLGALAYVKIKKDPAAPGAQIVDSGAVPLMTHYEKDFTNFKIYPLYEYTEDLFAKHRMKERNRELTLDYFSKLAAQILGESEIRANPLERP